MPERRFAHYEIRERIGRGGMGVVFHARDTLLGRSVAIKMLPGLLSSAPRDANLLLREARAAAALNHPNIATIYEVGEAEVDDPELLGDGESAVEVSAPVPYIAMEYVAGEDLRSRLRRGPLPAEDVVRIGLQIARGMAAAHRAKIVHRDLKPANVIVDAEGHVKLLDFGLAKFLRGAAAAEETRIVGDSLVTRDGVIVGTVPYMAPEQLEGRPVDERSDLFSLGVVLYEMIAGRPPFAAKAPVEYYKALAEEPEPLSGLHPPTYPELARIVHKLLALDPEERYQLAHEVVTDLAALARSDSETLTLTGELPLPSVRAVPVPARRRRTLLAATALVATLLTVALYLFFKPPPSRDPLNLAVRPFENLTGDSNEDDYCRGIGRVLIAQLRQVEGLNASDSQADAHKILEGTVERLPGRLAVAVHLRNAGDDVVEWSQHYEHESDEILELQVALARDAVRALDIPLSWRERLRLRRAPTRSVEAFRLYLQATSFLEEPKVPSLRKAEQRLRDAIDLDDRFALAHADLSTALWEIYAKTGKGDDALVDEAEREARRADELGAGFPETQIALAQVYRGNGQHARAIALLRELARRHPTLAEAHRHLAITHRQEGQLCDARKSVLKAIEVNALFWRNWDELGTVSFFLGDYETARDAYQQAAELAPPGISRPLLNLLAVQAEMGDFEGAMKSSESLPQPIDDPYLASNIGSAYFFTGHLDEARQYFELALTLTDDPYLLAAFRQNLGDLMARQERHEEARDEYQRALDLLSLVPDRPTGREELQLRNTRLLAKVADCYTAKKGAEEIQLNLSDSVEKFRTLAVVHALCEDRDAALEDIANAIREGAWGSVLGLWDEFETLAEDPEFQRLIALKPQIPNCPD